MATMGTALDFFNLLKLMQDAGESYAPEGKLLFIFSPVEGIYVSPNQKAIGFILDKPFVEPISGLDSKL